MKYHSYQSYPCTLTHFYFLFHYEAFISNQSPWHLPSYSTTQQPLVPTCKYLLWYSHHSESSEPVPPFWALDCRCRDRTGFCLHPTLQCRVSTRKMPEYSLLINFWLWTLLSLQLLGPVVIFSHLAEHCCVFYCIHKLWSIRGKQVLVLILLPVLFIQYLEGKTSKLVILSLKKYLLLWINCLL